MKKFIIETDEKEDVELYMKAGLMHSVIWEVDNFCRGKIKYSEDLSDETRAILEEIRSMLHEANIND